MFSNLEKHRRAVVDLACDVLCDAAGVGQEFGDSGFDLFADFDNGPLASTDKPRSHRDAILAEADSCDGIYLYLTAHDSDPNKPYHSFILIMWGNGVGNCVADYSSNLDKVEESIEVSRISDLMDHVEFMEI